MDANGQRFWMLADRGDWLVPDEHRATYDEARRSVRLRSFRVLPAVAAPGSLEGPARSALERVPRARDAYGMHAYWDTAAGVVMAGGALPGDVPLLAPPAPNDRPTDLAAGYDGILYLATAGGVLLADLRDRWAPVLVSAPDFVPWRLAPDPGGGAWVLDRTHNTLWRLRGEPRAARPFVEYAPGTVRPCEENADPPRLALVQDTWPDTEEAVALACAADGRLAVLTWTSGGDSHLRIVDGRHGAPRVGSPRTLVGAHYAYALAWISDDAAGAVVVRLPHFDREAPAFPADAESDGESLTPLGELYPLREAPHGPFVHTVTLPPHYESAAGETVRTVPLVRLSAAALAPEADVANLRVIDSGDAQTVWHRLYLEACIPPHCGMRVRLSASDELAAPLADDDWHPHLFGAADDPGDARQVTGDAEHSVPPVPLPRGVWIDASSEVPYHPGLAPCERERDRAGLFTVLVQRHNRRVRALRGRYLWVRVTLRGDARSSPELFALRAYGSRFSYRDRYLPELYREGEFGESAERVIPATERRTSTAADFLDRFLGNLEGVLTPLEDRIAAAHLLTDAHAAPDEALEWLGAWLGVAFDPAYPVQRRRALLEATPRLYRRRGTYPGLCEALEVATGGGVSGGEIVVVEDWRLRRTFATILGADLADEHDPLLMGIAASGNSFVGDTLFLGDETRREFLALFAADLDVSAREERAIAAFLDRLAYRATILVHQEVEPQDLGLVRRVAELESPAHVEVRVVEAREAFLVGLASLVQVDTYLAPKPPVRPVELGRSAVGVRDRLIRAPSVDPRLGAGRTPPAAPHPRPIADAGPDFEAPFGDSFPLDGSGSRAAEGWRLDRYGWTLLE